MDCGLITFLFIYFLTEVDSFSINGCFKTETTFCFGVKGNDTDHDPMCGCLGNNDCDVLVSALIRTDTNGDGNKDDTIIY